MPFDEMSKCMKKVHEDLNFLARCRENTRRIVLKHADGDLLQAISDAAYSVLDNRVPLTAAQRKTFRQYETILHQLATKQRTPTQKRKVLGTQRGASLIGILFNALKNLF